MSGKNIILDLDETLVHTHENEYDGTFENLYKYKNEEYMVNFTDLMENGDITTTKMWGIRRPYFQKFIKFCFDNFDNVIIWSAGTERYVKDTVNRVFYENKSPHYIFTQKDCYIDENGLTKPIKYLKKNNPYLKINIEDTILVDDREENFYLNKENGILIPVFDPSEKVEDKNLLKLMTWLSSKEFKYSDDIRDIDKKSIFD